MRPWIILLLNCILLLPVSGTRAMAREALVEKDIDDELMMRYLAPEDSLRRRAAEYLLEGLPLQWHYDVSKLEETGAKVKVMDCEVIDADYLAENIEYAFKAWELPWARDLSFEEFCR